MNRRQIVAVVVMAAGLLLVLGGLVGLLRISPSVEAGPTSVVSSTTATVGTTAASSVVAAVTTTTTSPSTTTSTRSTTTSAPAPTTTIVVAEAPEEFLIVLVQGLRADAGLLVSRLNQATLDIYGAEQCLATLGQVLDPETELEIREIGEPGPWDYVIDDITTPLDDVLGVEVERFVAGQTIIQELHWQLVDGQWTFFTDCGDPL